MQLRQLEYFLAIWESGSFSGAASRLYVAQPSVSQQIRILERELGAELLERGRHGVTLTPAGRAFLPQAQRVVQAAQDAKDSVRRVVEGRKGDVHVLTVRSVASGVLPPSAARWHSLFPTTVLRLHDFSHRRDLEEAVRGGQGDIAVGPRPSDWEGPVVSLGFEQMVVVGPDAYEIGAAAEPSELASADWVLYEPEQGMSEVVDRVAADLAFTPRAVARTDQVSAALQFAVEGIGMALAPENAVPGVWARHARRIGSGVFRELVAFSRKQPSQLAEDYRNMLTSAELPLTAGRELPPDALCC
ncbi:LysR family transcriptional regulator [Streptomyces sp. NBC_01244]|uniref:LysR family transcriptional regulator n=1 Tax=Streptomyces sp. NBC_01244 TaxID=2903797 RepID=UPI002E114A8F|nr:LysR family transcriptional regulator [Streptomyces sp. NBC_01244]